jgi:hypothetical protein
MRHSPAAPLEAHRIRRTHDEVAKLLARFHASGESQCRFAHSNGISQPTLSYWIRRARQRTVTKIDDPPRLVPVKITAHPGVLPMRSGFELDLPGGLRLWIPADFDEDALRRLLPIVAERC